MASKIGMEGEESMRKSPHVFYHLGQEKTKFCLLYNWPEGIWFIYYMASPGCKRCWKMKSLAVEALPATALCYGKGAWLFGNQLAVSSNPCVDEHTFHYHVSAAVSSTPTWLTVLPLAATCVTVNKFIPQPQYSHPSNGSYRIATKTK